MNWNHLPFLPFCTSAILSLAIGTAGCGSSDNDTGGSMNAAEGGAADAVLCIPGQSVACACTNGSQGAQRCNAQGTGLGDCTCSSADAGDSGRDGAAGSGGGDAQTTMSDASDASAETDDAADASLASSDAGDGSADATDAAGETGDAGACTCFQHGHWAIDNTSPCLVSDGNNELAISTTDQGGMAECPSQFSMTPTAPWSTDTLTTDCTGHYQLCVTLKAGDGNHPDAADCVLAHVCAEADYVAANMVQAFPNLPGWRSPDEACAQKFVDEGGYGEMSVVGTGTPCGGVAQRVFGVVQYCPIACSDANPPAQCAACVAGGGGAF